MEVRNDTPVYHVLDGGPSQWANGTRKFAAVQSEELSK
jgi:hypothetical protein